MVSMKHPASCQAAPRAKLDPCFASWRAKDCSCSLSANELAHLEHTKTFGLTNGGSLFRMTVIFVARVTCLIALTVQTTKAELRYVQIIITICPKPWCLLHQGSFHYLYLCPKWLAKIDILFLSPSWWCACNFFLAFWHIQVLQRFWLEMVKCPSHLKHVAIASNLDSKTIWNSIHNSCKTLKSNWSILFLLGENGLWSCSQSNNLISFAHWPSGPLPALS